MELAKGDFHAILPYAIEDLTPQDHPLRSAHRQQSACLEDDVSSREHNADEQTVG